METPEFKLQEGLNALPNLGLPDDQRLAATTTIMKAQQALRGGGR